MAPTLFVIVEAGSHSLAPDDLAGIENALSAVPGLTQALVLTPATPAGDQPFAADGPGPALVLQLDYIGEGALAGSLAGDGPLSRLDEAWPSLAGADVSHQVMARRDFPVAEPAFHLEEGGLPCTFLVEYPGTADDLPAWLDHYDANHPPIMVRFPGIRHVATFRPVDGWTSELPWAQGTAMQRNKVVFDSAAALVAALASPVMDEMRADAATFPPYRPRATHHPMDTRVVRPLG